MCDEYYLSLALPFAGRKPSYVFFINAFCALTDDSIANNRAYAATFILRLASLNCADQIDITTLRALAVGKLEKFEAQIPNVSRRVSIKPGADSQCVTFPLVGG
jgi:hypothetical protein